ncbi:MAG: AMP-binding protein, partial [bacterium]|nr:AMP-binding protein [bacterium]
MDPTFYVTLEKILLTANGKLNRSALPEPGAAPGTVYAPPTNTIQRKLVDIWVDVLAADRAQIGVDNNFFELGGHSLKATQLIAKIHKVLDVTVLLPELFNRPTIRTLAAYIQGMSKDKFLSIKAVEKKEYYALSSAQKRMFLLQQMESTGTGYNMPLAVLMEGTLDRERLENTFRKLIDRHESFRTSFRMRDGEAVQVIHNSGELEHCIRYHELPAGSSEDAMVEDFARPFDLSRAPLMRVAVIKKGNAAGDSPLSHILILDTHHIITDGVSLGVFVREFMALYAGKELQPLPLQYKDYSEWQKLNKEKGIVEKKKKYWLKQFDGDIPQLNLSTDFPRPAIRSFEGKTLFFRIHEEETAALKGIALKQGATLFMVLLTIFECFLSRLSGQDEIIIGTPAAGRVHADLGGIIGMFVNTLGIRTYLDRDKNYRALLDTIKETTLGAFENQDYQFEDLVERLDIRRDASRNPLFDAMFLLQNMEIAAIEIPGLKLKPLDYENKTAKFELTLQAMESDEELQFILTYATKLFKEDTAQRYVTYFKRIVSAVIEEPGRGLAEIEILSPEEKGQLLYDFNETNFRYPKAKTLHQLFEEQAERTPDRIALVGLEPRISTQELQVTYCRLREKIHRQAARLIRKGLQPGDITGIMAERSSQVIIGILGILKAGGAYMPIEPNYPQERIEYMMSDSGAKIILKGTDDIPRFSRREGFEVVDLNAGNEAEIEPASGIIRYPSPPALSYIIYTSGSTGKPKG